MLTNNETIDISVIVPARNEEKRIPLFLHDLTKYCQKSQKNYEIFVIDDGSHDQTDVEVQKFVERFDNIHLIKLTINKGKGYSVKLAMLKAQGEIALFMDADGSTPPEEIETNLHFFDKGFDVVIGSRAMQSDKHRIEAKISRKIIGRTFHFFVKSVLFTGIQDTQCGFKMFKQKTIIPLFADLRLDRFGFDLEVLYLASKLGFSVKETPVNWCHKDGSKVNLISDSFQMFINIFQIRMWHRSRMIYRQKQYHKVGG